MRIQRIYTEQPLQSGQQINLEEDSSHHLFHVLRLQSGDSIALFNNQGGEFSATLSEISKHGASAAIGELIREESSPKLAIQLMLGISRGERMDFALQKATELGVTRITPVFTKRCVVKLNEKKRASRMAHWRKIIINACEQSGRGLLPELDSPVEIGSAVSTQTAHTALLLDHRSNKTLAEIKKPKGTICILVGPEGGLSSEERKLAKGQGYTGIKLGPRIMRTETAPLAAIAAIQVLWGDFTE
ncbi:MAG: 16S rRNA (uracil(1498)-N(3))-methyltransferase [Candidatus Thiodiazotropha sp. (ex Monitilora ramsayi)]|nr:16S rRNA (uracil(1498)-N(3))-methyltransferase [Candidatus Thiodiazotropha sp. (ex Monitilora ramsayi)]